MNRDVISFFGVLAVTASACAHETHRTIKTTTVKSAIKPYNGPRHPIVVGNFANKSPYLRGVFTSGEDRLGTQARTILKTHLVKSGRFSLMDRDSAQLAASEAKLAGVEQKLKGAKLIVSGEVTEFGRKETGDKQLFGILGRGKIQAAYSKVSLLVVDVSTSEVVYSTQGAGEYQLDNREVLGFGSTSAYDSTLNGKVLELAITDALNKLIAGVENGVWMPKG